MGKSSNYITTDKTHTQAAKNRAQYHCYTKTTDNQTQYQKTIKTSHLHIIVNDKGNTMA